MFRDIGSVFEKRKKILDNIKIKDKEIKDSLKSFLEEEFGGSLKGFSFIINYNSRENSLSINPENKILASELTLRLDKLIRYLKRKGIKLERILIR